MPKNKNYLFLLITFLLASCGNSFTYRDKSVSVVLINDEHYQVVTTICEKAFFETGVETVVLPKSITKVEQLAFSRCALKKLYFFDNLIEISDGCFMEDSDFSSVYINTILPPKYSKLDRNATYADKVDRLVVNKGKKKIIILGGSGAL